MRFISSFEERAVDDVDSQYEYLEDKSLGLGVRFLAELSDTIDYLEQYPFVGRPVKEGIRRYNLKNFKFAIFYRLIEEKQQLEILTILHQSSDPGKWPTS